VAIIARFAGAAQIAADAGFRGVQIHAAHGYLFNQFLSPLVNQRTDRWGGSLENRMRLLIETVRQIRTAASTQFLIAVKLNSADFQRGGFDFDDSLTDARALEKEGIDLKRSPVERWRAPQCSRVCRSESRPAPAKPTSSSLRSESPKRCRCRSC